MVEMFVANISVVEMFAANISTVDMFGAKNSTVEMFAAKISTAEMFAATISTVEMFTADISTTKNYINYLSFNSHSFFFYRGLGIRSDGLSPLFSDKFHCLSPLSVLYFHPFFLHFPNTNL